VALIGVAAVASAEPAPPRSRDDQAWAEAARCFGGAWTACSGLRHVAGAADRRGFEARCRAGDPNGCALRGDWAFEHERDPTAPRGDDEAFPDDPARSLAVYRRACALGDDGQAIGRAVSSFDCPY
jgi:hypothetical protein